MPLKESAGAYKDIILWGVWINWDWQKRGHCSQNGVATVTKKSKCLYSHVILLVLVGLSSKFWNKFGTSDRAVMQFSEYKWRTGHITLMFSFGVSSLFTMVPTEKGLGQWFACLGRVRSPVALL